MQSDVSLSRYKALGRGHLSLTFNLLTVLLFLALVLPPVALAQVVNYVSGYAGAEAGDWGGKNGAATGIADGTCANMGAVGKVNLVSDFGFSIPGGAIVNGVEASIKSSTRTGVPQDVQVQLATDASIDPPVLLVDPPTGSGDTKILVAPGNGANCASTIETSTGGSSDLWNGVITPAIVNAPGFGMVFTKLVTSEIKVDAICMTVHYTTEGGPATEIGCFEAPPVNTITLQKAVSNDDGGTAALTDWTLTATGPDTISGVTGDPAITLAPVAPGVYALTETALAGYLPEVPPITCLFDPVEGSSTLVDTTLTLAEGESAVCTFLNDDIAPELTVIKHVVNDNGGTAVASQWTMDVTATSPSSTGFPGAESPGTTITIYAGTYSVDESGGPAGYAKTLGTGCSGTLAVGETASCTITNDDIGLPQLTIIKHVVNDNGGTAVASQWTMDVTATNPSSTGFPGAESPGTTITIDPGSYSVDESGEPTGYAKTLGAGCSGTLTFGETASCTITNDDIAPELTVIKHVVNDNLGTAVASQWTMDVTATNPSSTGFPGAESPGTTITIDAGTYSVDESGGPTGYAKTLGTGCSGTLAVGETASCTITNDDVTPGTIVFELLLSTGVAGDYFDISGDTVGSLTHGMTISKEVLPGSYEGRTLKSAIYNLGWTVNYFTCTAGGVADQSDPDDLIATFNVASAQTVTCTLALALVEEVPVPVNDTLALLLLILLILAAGWYFRPISMR